MRNLIFAVCLLALGGIGRGAEAVDARVEKAAREVSLQVAEKPEGLENLFDKKFFAHISEAKLGEILSGYYRDTGKVTEVRLERAGPGLSGNFMFDTEKGYEIPAALALDAESGKISGLFFREAYKKNVSLAEVAAGLSALPGRTGMLAVRLGTAPVALAALNEKEYFAVGSVFKLYVLGTMLEEGMSWSKVLRLREEDKSLPTGRLQDWPAGSPLTAHTLAALMISESDNTAADTLISALGRKTIESRLAALGHSNPALLTPFLKTSDMFRLKSDTEASVKYLNLPVEEKYGFLSALAKEPLSLDKLKSSPFGVARIEWPASPADVCGIMGYFARFGNAEALDILALNPGLNIPAGKIVYTGYKGGSEPGVLSMAWLLRNAGGQWFCLAASWNSEKKDLDEKKFFTLMQSGLNALAQEN